MNSLESVFAVGVWGIYKTVIMVDATCTPCEDEGEEDGIKCNGYRELICCSCKCMVGLSCGMSLGYPHSKR